MTFLTCPQKVCQKLKIAAALVWWTHEARFIAKLDKSKKVPDNFNYFAISILKINSKLTDKYLCSTK